MEIQRTQNSQYSFKEEQSWGNYIALKLAIKDNGVGIRTDMQINGTEWGSEINLYLYVQLIFNNNARVI